MSRWTTYPNVDFDNAPQDQHGRVAASGYGDDLHHPHDRAYGRQQAQQENAAECNLLLQVDVEFEEERDGQEEDDDIEEDGHGGQPVESCVVGEAFALGQRHPRFPDGRTLEDEDERSGDVAEDGSDHDDEDEDFVMGVWTSFQDAEVCPAKSNFEAEDANHVKWAAGEVDLPMLQHGQCRKQ